MFGSKLCLRIISLSVVKVIPSAVALVELHWNCRCFKYITSFLLVYLFAILHTFSHLILGQRYKQNYPVY